MQQDLWVIYLHNNQKINKNSGNIQIQFTLPRNYSFSFVKNSKISKRGISTIPLLGNNDYEQQMPKKEIQIALKCIKLCSVSLTVRLKYHTNVNDY